MDTQTVEFGENHAHIFMNAVNYKEAVQKHRNGVDERVIHSHFKQYQEKGISFIRDGGDALGVSERARQLAPEYGIDYRTPVFAIHKNGHYGGIVGKGFATMKEYADLVKEAGRRKADFIKIMTTGIMNFDTDGSITGEAEISGSKRNGAHCPRRRLCGYEPYKWSTGSGRTDRSRGRQRGTRKLYPGRNPENDGRCFYCMGTYGYGCTKYVRKRTILGRVAS